MLVDHIFYLHHNIFYTSDKIFSTNRLAMSNYTLSLVFMRTDASNMEDIKYPRYAR